MSDTKPSPGASKGDTKKVDAKQVDRKHSGDKDLTSILDEGQRADLTLLIADLTESMRKLILDNFDSTAALDKTLLREGMTEDEKLMMADPASADVAAYDRERKLKEENDKDLATTKMRTLKRDCLKTFDEWREQVVLRVGQVVNSERTVKKQVQDKAGRADMSKPQAPSTMGRVMEAPSRIVNLRFKDLFPPTRTPLTKMPMDQRTLILHSILLLLLSLEHYNAFSRILMLNLTSSLKLPLKSFEQDEYTTAKGLLEAAKEMSADDETKRKAEANKESRKWKVGIATAAGAAIIGVTGGLAAPLVAAGVGSVMGGLGLGATTAAAYLGSVAGSTVLVGGLFGAYGGRMTGQMMDAYAREVEDFQFLPIHGSSQKKTSEDEAVGAKEASANDHKLRVTIGISGWLTEKEEVVKPWRVLGTGAEVFALKYELEALLSLGNAMNGMVQSAAWGYAQKEIVKRTIFADLAAALWPIALLKVARVIDNPFSVAKSRAEKAGEVLADALINRVQGERPVTLIGYSLGARVIYTCLMILAKRKHFGIVENAVLIGSPTPSDTSDWRVLRSVVAGRLVNVFSVNDYVLGFMYRTSAIQYGVAGLQKVEGLSAVENFDVSEDVNSHQRYRYLIGAILKKIGFEDIDMVAVEKQQQLLIQMEEEEKKQSLQSQRRWLLRRQFNGGKENEAAEAEAEAEELEKKVQDQTEKGMMTKAIEYFFVPNPPDQKRLDKAARSLIETGGAASAKPTTDAGSTQGYAAKLYESLPSMPYVSRTAGGEQKPTPKPPSKAVKDPPTPEEKTSGQTKTYVQQASAYLPSLPSISVLSGRGKPPKLEKRDSASNVTKPNIDRVPSGVKTLQSPRPPKLDKTPSGVKSPPMKLERLHSGTKSPPTSVPTPNLVRQISSGVKSPPPKLGPRRTSSQQAQPPPPSPAALDSKLASLHRTTTGSGNAGRATQSRPSSTLATPVGQKRNEKDSISASRPTIAGKAGEAGKAAVQQGKSMLSGVGRAVGFSR